MREIPAIAPDSRIETKYLDVMGNPTTPEDAVRVITKEYDENGNFLKALVRFDPSGKTNLRG